MRMLLAMMATVASTTSLGADYRPLAALAGVEGVAVYVSLPSAFTEKGEASLMWKERTEKLLESRDVPLVPPREGVDDPPVLNVVVNAEPNLDDTVVSLNLSLTRLIPLKSAGATVRMEAWRQHLLFRVPTARSGEATWETTSLWVHKFITDLHEARKLADAFDPKRTAREGRAVSGSKMKAKPAPAQNQPESTDGPPIKYKQAFLNGCSTAIGITCCSYLGESCAYTLCQDKPGQDWRQQSWSCM
ncbi:hypothetical protein JKA73_17580 [Myxococcus xanthus]|uniref:hypothetical protein n=1 Tax=Myxococcus xanthus TaxID=34 RepID=UPI00191717D5|nr:hypothetical protein [Myxococcus xanthus]QQR47748.1 hypothetical protein JKA73_17580 [Myxococcus xanthus]